MPDTCSERPCIASETVRAGQQGASGSTCSCSNGWRLSLSAWLAGWAKMVSASSSSSSNDSARELGVHHQRAWTLDQQSLRKMDAKLATDVADNGHGNDAGCRVLHSGVKQNISWLGTRSQDFSWVCTLLGFAIQPLYSTVVLPL